MPTSTYDIIATYTTSTGDTSIVFEGIPQTYTDLVVTIAPLVMTGASTGDMLYVINSDTTNAYSALGIQGDGNGSAAGVTQAINKTGGTDNYLTYNFNIPLYTSGSCAFIINFNNYANTSNWKNLLFQASYNIDGGAGYTKVETHLWRNTGAINKIEFKPTGSGLRAGVNFSVYGIKAEA